MKRREFITLLGGAVAAWPLAARAQQTERIRRIGVLMGYPEAQSEFASFVQELQKLGWADGRNLQITNMKTAKALGLNGWASERRRKAPGRSLRLVRTGLFRWSSER
jgi:putative ABC transport system substrate-binding protein